MAEKILLMIACYEHTNDDKTSSGGRIVNDAADTGNVKLRDEPMTFALITMVGGHDVY